MNCRLDRRIDPTHSQVLRTTSELQFAPVSDPPPCESVLHALSDETSQFLAFRLFCWARQIFCNKARSLTQPWQIHKVKRRRHRRLRRHLHLHLQRRQLYHQSPPEHPRLLPSTMLQQRHRRRCSSDSSMAEAASQQAHRQLLLHRQQRRGKLRSSKPLARRRQRCDPARLAVRAAAIRRESQAVRPKKSLL